MEVRFVSPGMCAAVGLVVLAAAGCSDTRNPLSPQPDGAQAAIQGEPSLGADVAAVRRATAAFHDVDVAMAAGYLDPTGRVCDEIAAGAMGIHSPNGALVASQTINPLTPEVLLFLPKPGGGFRLVGVEYVQFVLLRNPATGQVAPWASTDPWPSTYEVVTPTPSLFGRTFDGPMPGHFPGHPWHWDLHAWIWADNPNGMFAQWNPALSCD